MTDIDGVRMYFGSASGSSRKALRKAEESHVMVSAQTNNNQPWKRDADVFLDSGGYSLMIQRGEHPPADDYLDTVERHDPALWAVQDYPCEPDILDEYGRSVRDHQRRTTVATAECLVRAEERGIDAEPVAVIQGWERDDYLAHIDELADEGLLTDHVGIGSVCRRHSVPEIREIIAAIHDRLPDRKLHAFGVKNKILSDPETRAALHSVDTTAWYYRNYDHRNEIDETWQEVMMQYFKYRHRLAEIAGVMNAPEENQQALTHYG